MVYPPNFERVSLGLVSSQIKGKTPTFGRMYPCVCAQRVDIIVWRPARERRMLCMSPASEWRAAVHASSSAT